jgi:hypothetical protein
MHRWTLDEAFLKVSILPVKRDWNFAKAWLFDQLSTPSRGVVLALQFHCPADA